VAEQRVLVRELPELERRLAAIAAPTTIVCGTEDRVVTAAAARALQTQIPGAHLVMLPGAGHLLPQGHAGELAEVIATAEVDVSGPIP
jgi:pimeloyl-ACP methyl ester carboxylesterase